MLLRITQSTVAPDPAVCEVAVVDFREACGANPVPATADPPGGRVRLLRGRDVAAGRNVHGSLLEQTSGAGAAADRAALKPGQRALGQEAQALAGLGSQPVKRKINP